MTDLDSTKSRPGKAPEPARRRGTAEFFQDSRVWALPQAQGAPRIERGLRRLGYPLRPQTSRAVHLPGKHHDDLRQEGFQAHTQIRLASRRSGLVISMPVTW
jgi:hypothetical protein